jgi:hypothetical protein
VLVEANLYAPANPNVNKVNPVNRVTMTGQALQALREAVARAIEDHRRRGIPVGVWHNGKAVSIPAEQAAALHESAVPYSTKSRGAKT